MHHRHLRNEADANLAQEIRDNRKEVSDARAAIVKERENLLNVLKFLQARGLNRPYEIHTIALNFSLGTLHTASWRTASATGALGYMEYRHVQRYSAAYQIQDEFSALQTHTLDDFLQLESHFVSGFDPEKMPPADAAIAASEVHRTLSHLQALDQFGEALTKSYDQALAGE
jgi:hypothetical protein